MVTTLSSSNALNGSLKDLCRVIELALSGANGSTKRSTEPPAARCTVGPAPGTSGQFGVRLKRRCPPHPIPHQLDALYQPTVTHIANQFIAHGQAVEMFLPIRSELSGTFPEFYR